MIMVNMSLIGFRRFGCASTSTGFNSFFPVGVGAFNLLGCSNNCEKKGLK